MAKAENAGFVEKHIEKVLLAGGLLFLIVAVALVAGWPREVSLTPAPRLGQMGKPLQVEQVDGALLAMAEKMPPVVEIEKPDPEPVDDYSDLLLAATGAPTKDLPGLVPWTPPNEVMSAGSGPAEQRKVLVKLADLQPLGAPETPKVKVSRETLVVARPPLVAGGAPTVEYKEVIASHGAMVVGHGEIIKKWREALAKVGIPETPTFIRVEVERRRRLTDGSWGQPTSIARVTADPTSLPELPAYDNNRSVIASVIKILGQPQVQESILEPPYWNIVAAGGTEVDWLLLDKPRTRVSDMLEQPAEGTIPGYPGEPTVPGMGRPPAVTPGGPRPGQVPPGMRGLPSGVGEYDRRGPGGPMGTAARGEYDMSRGGYEDPEAMYGGGRPAPTVRPPTVITPTPVVDPNAPVPFKMPENPPLVPSFLEQYANPKGILEAWFHDADNLQEEQTYSYRVRLVVANPLFGLFTVASDEDASQVTLNTPWSEWSEPVTVGRATQFFVVGGGLGQSDMVSTDVFTIKWGQHVMERFTVRRGEAIGGVKSISMWNPTDQATQDTEVDFSTGAVVVDIFLDKKVPYAGFDRLRSTTEMLYVESDGQLRTRSKLEDADSDAYKDLLSKVAPKR